MLHSNDIPIGQIVVWVIGIGNLGRGFYKNDYRFFRDDDVLDLEVTGYNKMHCMKFLKAAVMLNEKRIVIHALTHEDNESIPRLWMQSDE